MRLLLTADHASNHVPASVMLGLAPQLLDSHIAVDLGVEALTRSLARRLEAPAVLASVSRLVVDPNRSPDEPAVIPAKSDGHAIPGNMSIDAAERAWRIVQFHAPYHAAIAAAIERLRPVMLVSLHSFTPRLASRPEEERPWPIGLLYNSDERAARLALRELAAAGLDVGDNQPYSGRQLNYTMNRHAGARSLPYLNFELRQDELAAAAGVETWAERLAWTVERVASVIDDGR